MIAATWNGLGNQPVLVIIPVAVAIVMVAFWIVEALMDGGQD